MKKIYVILAIIYLVVFLISLFPGIRFYIHCIFTSNSLQVPIFSGLLTVGTFLLSMKTFIIFKLKDDLYDNPAYVAKVKKTLLTEEYGEHDHYGGLKQLSGFLSLSVFGALVGAIASVTIGYLDNSIASSICISLATCAIGILFFSWWLVWANLRNWLDTLKAPPEA